MICFCKDLESKCLKNCSYFAKNQAILFTLGFAAKATLKHETHNCT